MGVDYRVVNGYVYISPNPVTDPDKIAERAEYFEKRAGHYFQNWDELYAGWREQDGGAEPRGRVDRGARPAGVRARRGRLRRAEPQQHRPAARLLAHAALRRDDVAAPLRVPAARLRRLPDVRGVLRAGAAGHPRPAHRADGRRHRRGAVPGRRGAAPAGAPGDRDGRRRRRSPRAARPAEIDAELSRERRGPALARRARGDQGPVVQHGHRATASTTTTAAGTTTRASRTRR